MTKTETILRYLQETYQPRAIIVYGSFADGSAGEHSDFDALVITDHTKKHDTAVIDQTMLDVFLYPAETFRADYDPQAFIQVYDGNIVLDTDGIAARLQQQVRDAVEHMLRKTEDEVAQEIDWCEKMLLRAERGDAEGYFRWHWVLTDSLEIYFDVKSRPYFGPKKALRQMEQTDPDAFLCYSQALKHFDRESLSRWISRLKRLGP